MTLVELLAAMTISGLVLMTAHAALGALSQADDRVRAAAAEADESGIGERYLVDLFARSRVGVDSGAQFAGDSLTVQMRSSCTVAGGWIEPCAITLRIEPRSAHASLVLDARSVESPVLPVGIARRFVFAERVTGGLRWHSDWTESSDAPPVVAVVTRGDTLLLALGAAR